MKILRVKDSTLFLSDLRNWLGDKSIVTGEKFAISWKVGKRRKLRSYRLLDHSGWECDCCGWITRIELGRGSRRSIVMDNHFGVSSFGVNS